MKSLTGSGCKHGCERQKTGRTLAVSFSNLLLLTCSVPIHPALFKVRQIYVRRKAVNVVKSSLGDFVTFHKVE